MMDKTFSFFKNPYTFITKGAAKAGKDIFETRIMMKQTFCLRGQEAAELFTREECFIKKGAAPEMMKATLLGKGDGIQGLDGEKHRKRKALFMSFMTKERIEDLASSVHLGLKNKALLWQDGEKKVKLYEEFQEILTKAICEWVGVPLKESEIKKRTRQLTALFDKAGSKGPGHLKARIQRKLADKWIRDIVKSVRAGELKAPPWSPLEVMVQFTEADGTSLDDQTCAVELLNLLRPTVAVSLFLVFSAHALHFNGKPSNVESFILEVRRFYPFFPALMSRVAKDFEWQGIKLKAGARAMLDIYGTDHDERIYLEPERFNADRFINQEVSLFSLIPQGTGDHLTHHRCPGEAITIKLMEVVIDFLINEISYDVPEQDLTISLKRIPSLPKSHFLIGKVKLLK